MDLKPGRTGAENLAPHRDMILEPPQPVTIRYTDKAIPAHVHYITSLFHFVKISGNSNTLVHVVNRIFKYVFSYYFWERIFITYVV